MTVMALEIIAETNPVSLLDVAINSATLLLTIGSAVGVALPVQRVQLQHVERMALVLDLDVARREGRAWRNKAQAPLNGPRLGITNQFDDWGMTDAERDVGLLILKGLSHTEIASLRGTTEATVRQQAQSIYARSDLPGKSAFSA